MDNEIIVFFLFTAEGLVRQGLDLDQDLGIEIVEDQEVENTSAVIENETGVDHGGTNLHQPMSEDMRDGKATSTTVI